MTIAQARREWLAGERGSGQAAALDPWLLRSWQRCLAAGRQPEQRVVFEAVSAASVRRLHERNRALVAAARPVIERLSRAIAGIRYFPVLTDADGIVLHVGGLPGGSDAPARQARDIARIGVDLSERAVGTTAIGAALAERESVWLHRGEHFFEDTGVYSCAGAPLFGVHGDCIGMLDLTGVQVAERPELRHLAAASARSIENALLLAQPHALLLQIAWPGTAPGAESEGLMCLDADGLVTGANAAARHMLHRPLAGRSGGLHCSELFALPPQALFDAARRGDTQFEAPLWSGLRVQVRPRAMRPERLAPLARPAPVTAFGPAEVSGAPAATARPLRELESELIREAVANARGNVAQAARTLGISRATVYRKLGRGRAAS